MIELNVSPFINHHLSQADFNARAIELFRVQAKNNAVYRQYLALLKKDADEINAIADIPFLPISCFKQFEVKTGQFAEEVIFSSSATTGSGQSKHYVKSVDLYRQSFLSSFELFYGNPAEWTILALLPSYLERQGSSLILMADELIKKSNDPRSGFFLNEFEQLKSALNAALQENRKVLLLGVTFALLDFAEYCGKLEGQVVVMETGGMKGRREEWTRDQVHGHLKHHFGLDKIHSEYGMTELLSQAYSSGDGIFRTPPWMRVYIREVNDPFAQARNGKSGGVNIIDLANEDSCAFIATEDLGRMLSDDSFEILGRFDHAEMRGCNLLVW